VDEVRIISVGVSGESAELLLNYKNEVGATWEFVIDDNGAFNKYSFLPLIPTIVILKDGERVYRHIGVTYSDDLIREIEKVL